MENKNKLTYIITLLVTISILIFTCCKNNENVDIRKNTAYINNKNTIVTTIKGPIAESIEIPVESYLEFTMTEPITEQTINKEKETEEIITTITQETESIIETTTSKSSEESIEIQPINPNIIDYSYSIPLHSTIKNQGKRNTCWACAALTAIETVMIPETKLELSVDHITMCNSFNVTQYNEGEYMMALAYLAAWQGPVLEKDDPYGDEITDISLKPALHLQEAQMIFSKDIEKIKEMVNKYGGVQTSLYLATETSKYYNEQTAAYCYTGTKSSNHDVVIIGWDDDFPKEYFNSDVKNNGAFICQNSWGTDFGKDGIFYVSYYDANIGTQNIIYTRIESSDNYDRIYQTDLCGWQGMFGYGQSDGYFANVYNSQSSENIRAVGFYALDVNTSYTVYIIDNFENENSFENMIPVAAGQFENIGYYTVPFPNPIAVVGNKFAVIVKINTPNSERPIAVEMEKDFLTSSVDISDGEGYVSSYGDYWERIENYNCNICLKAFTDVQEEN